MDTERESFNQPVPAEMCSQTVRAIRSESAARRKYLSYFQYQTAPCTEKAQILFELLPDKGCLARKHHMKQICWR